MFTKGRAGEVFSADKLTRDEGQGSGSRVKAGCRSQPHTVAADSCLDRSAVSIVAAFTNRRFSKPPGATVVCSIAWWGASDLGPLPASSSPLK